MDEPAKQPDPIQLSEIDPAQIIPLEAAKARLRHWWGEPLSGFIAVTIGVYDSWHYGHDAGLSSSLDEILVIGGIVLMAGLEGVFSSAPPAFENKGEKKKNP